MILPLRSSALLLSLALAACGSSEQDTPPALVDAPNVLLVTLDTTRADHLGCYGHEGAKTPTLDRLAATGVRFDRAYAQVPLTLPSHASLLSGVHPAGTGVHVNFQGAPSAEVPLLAEFFAASGYRTAAFVAAWVLNSDFGLDRGFERYDDLSARSAGRDQQVERGADEIVDAALPWLESLEGERFFCWLHFFDPHDPYEPPAGFDVGFDHPYDGELAFVDAELARVVDWLEARGLRETTLIVVTGDHGEGLGEHDETTHGLFLYESSLHVPLIFSQPGRLREGARVGAPVALVDVCPTILELSGGELPATVEGVSLRSPLDGGPFVARPIYAETEYPLRSFHWAPLRALVVGAWKYIEAPRPELYHHEEDPGEAANLFSRNEIITGQLREALAEHRRGQAKRRAGEVQLPPGAEAALADLGYVGGTTELDESAELGTLADPKERTAVFRGVMRAKHLADRKEYHAAATLLSTLVTESPESDEIWGLYGTVLLELGPGEAARLAVEALEKSLRSRPDQPARLRSLGDALAAAGRDEEALSAYDRALALAPDDPQLFSRKGLIHARHGELDQAREQFERQVALAPSSANAQTNLANLEFAAGQFDEGLRRLERALECDPACRPAHLARIDVLIRLKLLEEASAALEVALAALPGDRELAQQLEARVRPSGDAAMLSRLEAHLLKLRETGARAPDEKR